MFTLRDLEILLCSKQDPHIIISSAILMVKDMRGSQPAWIRKDGVLGLKKYLSNTQYEAQKPYIQTCYNRINIDSEVKDV